MSDDTRLQRELLIGNTDLWKDYSNLYVPAVSVRSPFRRISSTTMDCCTWTGPFVNWVAWMPARKLLTASVLAAAMKWCAEWKITIVRQIGRRFNCGVIDILPDARPAGRIILRTLYGLTEVLRLVFEYSGDVSSCHSEVCRFDLFTDRM
jgi:hypothetical protein